MTRGKNKKNDEGYRVTINQQIVERNVLLMEKVFLSQRKERRKKRGKSRGGKKLFFVPGGVAADALPDWVSGLILQEVCADWLVNEKRSHSNSVGMGRKEHDRDRPVMSKKLMVLARESQL